MPVLKIDRIVSFSSEDEVHVASSIIGNKTSLKWKCKSPGEKNAVIVLQLEKASVISGIDIGNEHSAYIEVLVSRSGDDADYKTFLVMSTFMSAMESRQSVNINKVRMFKKDDFSKPENEQKWDRVKIVCTQPFNRHVQYGLSFIKFHTNEIDKTNNATTDSDKKMGKFVLKPESPKDLTAGTLFSKWKEQKAVEKDKPLTAAAAIRDATSSLLNDTGSPSRSPKLLPSCIKNLTSKKKKNNDTINLDDIELKPRNRKELLYTEDEEQPNTKIDKFIEKRNAEKLKKQEEELQTPTTTKKREKKTQDKEKPKVSTDKKEKNNESKAETSFSRKEKESTKRKLSETVENTAKKTKVAKVMKPFYRLLEDVVLVISGIQNPDRATLRGKILEMGAKYKPDWDSSCTHLVCAFMNTPKFHQVRGKGKIVTRKWIEESYSQRKKLPWRRYCLDKREKDKDESEDEIFEQIEEALKSPTQDDNHDVDDYDDHMEQPSDSEDVVQQIENTNSPLQKNITNTPKTKITDDPYSVVTDSEEEPVPKKNKSYDFFKKRAFFVDTGFEDYIQEKLKEYIFIHEGSLADDETEKVDYIICGTEEAQHFKTVNTEAACILPDWVFDCHKCRTFIPPDEYFIL